MCNRFNGLVGSSNGNAEQPACTWAANGANKKLVLHMRLGYGSLSITAPVSLQANEFDVRSVLQGQMNVEAAN